MPVPDQILERLGQLAGSLEEISGRIGSIIEDREELIDGLDDRLAELEAIVDQWLANTAGIEAELIRLVPAADDILDLLEDPEIEDNVDSLIEALRATPTASADPGGASNEVAADALSRLFGITLLHLSIACDVGSLAQLEEVERSDWTEVARTLSRPSTIFDTAFGAGLVDALQSRLDALVGPDLLTGTPEGEALNKILEQARDVTKAVLSGSAPIAGMVFSHVKAAMSAASLVGPAEFHHALGTIASHVKRIICKLIRRVRNVVECVSSSYGRTVNRFIDRWVDKEREKIVDSVVDSVLARVFAKRELEQRIEDAIADREARGDPRLSRRQIKDLDDLLKSNSRWVGPAETAAKGLHFLWAVQLGPVPAAPVAACVMLAWTLIITGDQLDARGPFPRFWDGVATIAIG